MKKDFSKDGKFESKNTVDAPSERLQNDQTTDQVIKTNTTVTPKTSFDIKEQEASGSQLKQEVAAAVLSKKGGAGSSLGSQVVNASTAGLRSGSYSGDAGTLLGSAANTPVMTKEAQGNDRVDKRLSDANKDINYLASEQYATEFKNIAPLSEDKSTVGYNGNPMNISARSQKTSGFTPAEVLYDRSLDEIRVDKVLFTNGQTIKQDGVQYIDYPTKTNKLDQTGKYVLTTFTAGKEPIRGNFAPSYIEVEIKKDATGTYLSKFVPHEDDLSINDADYQITNDSSVNFKIDLNQAELARQRIDANAGSPSSEHYNPLGRSTNTEPTPTVMYIRDREAGTGATMLTALRCALKSRAYYLSRTGKDGQDNVIPALDSMYGHLCGSKNPAELSAILSVPADGELSIKAANNYGSANIMLHIYDSIKKYKTKADLVNQPRGFKLPLSTGLNNHTPFHYKKEFIKALNANDYFSTIDRGYDPSSATFVTDGIRLVYPYSWERSLSFTRSAATADRTYSSELFTYAFQAGKGNQRYVIKVADPILNGVAWFIEQHAATIYSACEADDSVVKLKIPTIHYGAHFGLWDLLLCAAAPYIEYERTNSFKDVLDYEVSYGYPFPELETISEDAVRTPKNYGRLSEYERLTVEQMKPDDAIRVVMPEVLMPLGEQDILMPFYFNEESFELSGSNSAPKISQKDSCQFSTPVIRTGVKLAYLDDFFGMEPKDVLLSYDIMTALPGYHSKNVSTDGYVYKYSLTNDGLIAMKNPSGLKVLNYLKTPRQLGWFMNAPAGYCRALKASNVLGNAINPANYDIRALGCSETARIYFGLKTKPSAILSASALTIDRAQAFTQTWAESCANYTEGKAANFDLMLSTNDIFDVSSHNLVFKDNVSRFKPYTRSVTDTYTNGPALSGLMMGYWTRVQKLPYVINPFDATKSENALDPFDFAYIFGLAGFLAADYNEEKYNRINAYQDQMFGFVDDPYVLASPIFK